MGRKKTTIFGDYKECEFCKRPLPDDYDETMCPHCIENQLFHEVKEFIRENDVNEYQVAAEFHIPVRQVKEWIREGRIEYKTQPKNLSSDYCVRCGASILFGSYCSKCMKLASMNKGYAVNDMPMEDSQMRFLNLGDSKHKK